MAKILYKDLSYKINGLLFKTHKIKGRYANEKQHADCFEDLLREEGIKYEREYRFEDQQYGGMHLRFYYRRYHHT